MDARLRPRRDCGALTDPLRDTDVGARISFVVGEPLIYANQ